jgi:hypothetical protein
LSETQTAAPAADTYTDPGTGVTYARVPDATTQAPPASATPAPTTEKVVDPVVEPAKAPEPAADPAADPLAAAGDKAVIKVAEEGPDKPAEPVAEIKAADYKLALPEGVDGSKDPLIQGFLQTAAANKLSNEQVQALYDTVAPQIAQNQRNAWANTITAWQDQTKQDAEIGGDKLTGVQARVSAALRQFGGITGADGKVSYSEITDFLNMTGAHSHPVFIRLINRMAAPLSEGTPVVAGDGSGVNRGQGQRNAADLLYPTHSADKAA